MQFLKSGNEYIIRLIKGESFTEKLLQFANEENINTAFFYGLGGVLSAELAYYDLDKKEYQKRNFDKTHEIVSLSGNITLVDGKPFIHVHTVLSDENFDCHGGHLVEAIIGGTCEIHLFKNENTLSRDLDHDTGLKLINCNITNSNQA